jgi:hypothetical protein
MNLPDEFFRQLDYANRSNRYQPNHHFHRIPRRVTPKEVSRHMKALLVTNKLSVCTLGSELW